MKKIIATYVIPALILGFFVIIVRSPAILKKPLDNHYQFSSTIKTVIGNIKNEDWDQASRNRDKMESQWNKIVKSIQFGEEKDNINSIDINLSRLEAAIDAKNKALALQEIDEALLHWKNIGQ